MASGISRRQDPYAVLGVPRTASAGDIKAAFRKLAKLHHPDLNRGEDASAAEARFKEAVEAYELLGDAARRRDFDAESRGFGGDYGGVDDATAREWARAAADQTRWERAAGGAWGPRYTHSARAGNEEWRSFDFEEARQLSRWAVPAQVAAFACVGVAVWAGASGLFDPPSNQ